ncbi:MAG TPA: sugar ABC transporter permease, partial [Betaproteobacteria bacterium]|nr:sugar ABC transporter permease [Betaproteobacteria bacterium]
PALGLIILAVSFLFVPITILHPFVMLLFLFITSFAFSLLGFIIGICARNFEQLNIVPTLILTPLVFLGGSFYSIKILPPIWQTITLFNPALYLISGFRWAFFGVSDVPVTLSLAAIGFFSILLFGIVSWIFSLGYRLRN